MASGEAYYGGTSGTRFVLHLDAVLLSQNTAGNYSTVRISAYMKNVVSSTVWNSDPTYANTQFNGGNLSNTTINGYGNGGSSYPVGTQWQFASNNRDVIVYHNTDGTKTCNFYAYHDPNNSPFLGATSVSFNYTLPTIATIPTITTTSASSILPTTTVVGGNVTSSGNATITQRGIYYSTTDTTPDSNDSKKTVTGTTGSFTTTLTGLTPNTLYYYRAYAINSQGEGVGAVKTFTTAVTPYASMIYSNANPYADGKLMRDTGAGWTDVTTGDLYFETFSEQGATTVPQNSLDPSVMITNALTYFNSVGGIVSDNSTVDLTGTTSSYTFVSQSVYEVINKCLTLAPYNWYWYVDPATNYLHFHEKSNVADHKLVLGKDIKIADVEKRGEDIINVIYFTGGDTGGGSILYRKYQNNYSIGIYGQRATKIIDERVTSATTAELIANNLLARQALPEVRLKCTIADSNVGTGAYDIETIQVGDVVNVQNVKGSTGSSLWDEAILDVDSYDFDVNKITSMNLQVVRKEYNPSEVTIVCSTIPPEVTKRIEDISRNLQNSQTINNPDTPS